MLLYSGEKLQNISGSNAVNIFRKHIWYMLSVYDFSVHSRMASCKSHCFIMLYIYSSGMQRRI